MGKFEFAIQVMVIGFTVVLVTLFLLYGILIIFSRLFSRPESQSGKRGPIERKTLPVDTATTQAKVTAAITAAVSSYLEGQGNIAKTGKINVRPRPIAVSTSNNWQITGRKMLMQGASDIEKTRRNLG
jgi:Na+-transporting methylmalonyl-CoA/oxaloacetate decarboxylase gamma subunit